MNANLILSLQQCQTNGIPTLKMKGDILAPTNGFNSNATRKVVNNNNNNSNNNQPMDFSHKFERARVGSATVKPRPNKSTWKLMSPSLVSIAIYNFNHTHRSNSTNETNNNSQAAAAAVYLNFHLGDVLIIVEQMGPWFRGYLDRDPNKMLGIFPANYVQVFDSELCKPLSNMPNSSYLSSFFYILLDPLFLQVVRSLRDWQQCLFQLYRNNNDPNRFKTVGELIRELINLAALLSKDMAPALWEKRSNRLLKLSTTASSPKDPFGGLDEEENGHDEQSPTDTTTLEEIYDKVLRRLNKCNYLLDMDIMPSFTHSAFGVMHLNKSRFNSVDGTHQHQIRKIGKFRPYNPTTSSRYLTHVLNYYSRLKRNYKHLSNKLANNLNGDGIYGQCPSSPQAFLVEKAKKCCRRHLLLSIKDVNFATFFNISDAVENSPMLQVDAYVLRTKGSSLSSSAEGGQQYEIVSEKYCYRVRANGQVVSSGMGNVSRALFVDILSKKSNGNGNGGGLLHSESQNYYLVVQVWRYGKMHIENKTKNMLSSGASLATGSSVFHTISSSSLTSTTQNSITNSSSTSLSTLTSFVSNVSSSSFFGEKNPSSTSDSTSIDSSEFGASSFKRSVGFSVISFQDLVSHDQELKAFMSHESITKNSIDRLLLNDNMMVATNLKLYEGDFTVANLETLLKCASQGTSLASTNAPISLSNISKLPLLSNVHLSIGAKYLSEYFEPESAQKHQHDLIGASSRTLNNCASSIIDSMMVPLQSCGGIALVKKRSFGDIIAAGQFRNDLYLTLDSAEFDKGGKAIGKNIEVSVCLITEKGVYERAISSGANDEQVTIYRSHIQYHQNGPKWFEHIKVNVPLEQFETAHLRFTFAHCSTKERERKLIGFSFLPLADKHGACIPDGDHELYIYKCDNERKLDESSFYLNQVAHGTASDLSTTKTLSTSSTNISGSISSSSLLASRSAKEIFHLRTNLVSSKLTQNANILSLLKYSSTLSPQVFEALQQIGRVPGEEMVKFLEDILDALFALFTMCLNNPSTASIDSPQISLIFKVLVDFLKILNEPKFASYLSALDTYVAQQFSAPLVHSALMSCVWHHVQLVINSFRSDNSMSGGKKRELEFCLRCLSVSDWILKMIIQSRLLYSQAASSGSMVHSEGQIVLPRTSENFMTDLWSFFNSLNLLLAVESKSSDDYLLIAIQESVLSTLPNTFFYLSKMLSPLELTKLIQSIVQFENRMSDWTPATPTNGGGQSSFRRTITDSKLLLFQTSTRCKYIWLHDEARLELLYTFVRLFNVHITESKCCLKILDDIIMYLIDKSRDQSALRDDKQRQNFEREIDMLSIGIYESLMEHIIKLIGIVSNTFELLASKSDFVVEEDYLGKLIVCFILLLDFLNLKNYEKLFENREANHCKGLINNIFVIFLNALYYFSENWLEIKMELNRIILNSLIFLKTIMARKFLGSPEKFDVDIWKTYFKLATAFLTQSRLQLDGQPHWKQRLIFDVYGGDLRVIMGRELINCWALVDQNKTPFVPSMVAAFVDAVLVPQLEVRRMIIPIFYDMMAIDYQNNSNFYQVESQLINRLDNLAYKLECDAHFKELFTQILLTQIEKKKPIWYLNGVQFVKSISRQLSLLIDYRNELKFKLKGTNEVDDRLLMSTYSLLRFYQERIKSADCQTIMVRYIEKLSSLHLALENYSEAAFTFQLQSDLLTWTSENATKKEQLNEKMLNLFEKGKCWEEGLKICKELEHVYVANYKYKKLSHLLQRRAKLLDNILNIKRPENEYFRVSFYGLDFPSFLQNNTFIFRGFEFEKLPSFSQRIQQQFPNAQLLTKMPSDEDITKSSSQYLQIFTVKPIPEPPTIPEQALILGQPDDVFSFYNTNCVRKFIQDRPVQRGVVDKNNEFKSLWIERTIFTVEKHLPGLLKAFELVRTPQTIFLSPIENACEAIEKMNNELSAVIMQYTNVTGPTDTVAPLSMRLQGILEAAVNGGIAKYIEAFLSTDFLTSNPDQIANVTRLKNRISLQCKTVESGLMLHGQLAPPLVRPLHSRLLERFSTMRTMVQQANHETAQAMLWSSSSQQQPQQPCISLALTAQPPQRPSILSQPLPPIPSKLHELSDVETSSHSSSSSLNIQPNSGGTAIEPIPLPPKTLGSPSKVSMKSRTLSTIMTSSSDTHQHKMKPMRSMSTTDESIYSLPQLPEYHMLINCTNSSSLVNMDENESSVDDSFDNYTEFKVRHLSSKEAKPEDMKGLCSINRSRSIPRQTLLAKQSNNLAHQQQQQRNSASQEDGGGEEVLPPPLPPRTANLDRSNSLNSDVRTLPVIPPALPQRLVRNSSASSNCKPNEAAIPLPPKMNKLRQQQSPDQFITGLDNEFGNLVISSPTPRNSDAGSNGNNRPAPIIGIELNNDTVTPLVSLINSKQTTQATAQERRTKSSSLPRMQQFVSTTTSPASKTNCER